MRYIFCLLLCVCFITFGLTACHKDEDIAALKDEIKQRWNIEVVDHNLQDTLRALLVSKNSVAQLQDVSPKNEGACLKVVIQAFSIYPAHFIKSLISRVAVADTITTWSIEVGGFNFDNTIAIDCDDVHGQGVLSADFLQKWKTDNIHAFIARIILEQHKWLFQNQDWQSYNPSDFHYGNMEDYKNSLRDHSPNKRNENNTYFTSGFITQLGMTAIDQDFPDYAMRIFGEPREFAQIIRKYPRVKGKARIVMNIYLTLAPELKSFFDQSGLTDAVKN